jgi:hypothetical protein
LIVIDDQLLLATLSDTAPADISTAVARGEVFTTGSWYYRLGRAVTAGSGAGTLSSRFQALDEPIRRGVLAALDELPEEIGLLSLRVLVPVMQALAVTRPLNFLNAEALGAALLLDAAIAVTVDAPLLRSGATDLAVTYTVIG